MRPPPAQRPPGANSPGPLRPAQCLGALENPELCGRSLTNWRSPGAARGLRAAELRARGGLAGRARSAWWARTPRTTSLAFASAGSAGARTVPAPPADAVGSPLLKAAASTPEPAALPGETWVLGLTLPSPFSGAGWRAWGTQALADRKVKGRQVSNLEPGARPTQLFSSQVRKLRLRGHLRSSTMACGSE